MRTFFKGIHYNNRLFYNGITWCLLRHSYHKRFYLAAQYIQAGDCVLDVCSGFGQLRQFLPEKCTYKAIEGNTACVKYLKSVDVDCLYANLHNRRLLCRCYRNEHISLPIL